MDTPSLEKLSNEMRIDIVRMICEAGSGHPGGSLSCIDILTALYFGDVLNQDPNDPHKEDRDWFFLAKGHSAPALYTALAHAGYFSRDELMSLRKWGSRLQGHPDSTMLPGVEVSTGSLGQGLSIAVGTAIGLRLKDLDSTVFALLGDGEIEEGQVWEAAMFASHMDVDNLVAIVDNNGLQIDGEIEEVCNPQDIAEKFQAFGWEVTHVDGHDIAALIDVLNAAKHQRAAKPKMIIAHTIKGKGVSFMENEAGWHGKAPTPEQCQIALEELQAYGR